MIEDKGGIFIEKLLNLVLFIVENHKNMSFMAEVEDLL